MVSASRGRLVCLNHMPVDGHVQSSVQNDPRFMRQRVTGTPVLSRTTLPEDTHIQHTYTHSIFNAHRVNDSDTGGWTYKHILHALSLSPSLPQRRMTVICCACLAFFSSAWRPSCCAERPLSSTHNNHHHPPTERN